MWDVSRNTHVSHEYRNCDTHTHEFVALCWSFLFAYTARGFERMAFSSFIIVDNVADYWI